MNVGRITQRLAIVASTILATCSLAHAAKSDAKHFQYVADAVNQINYLKAISSSPKDHSEEIADTACKMLTQLVADEQFSTLVRKGWPGGMSAEQKKTLLGLGAINDAVEKERQTLEDVGLNPLTSLQALAAAIPFAKSIDPEKIDPDLLLKDISNLQQNACSLTGQIEDSEKWEKKKNAVVLGVSGVAVVLADGAAEYYSWGLADFIAKFSFAIGGGMIVQAAHDLSAS